MFSEADFKALNYLPEFPERFQTSAEARTFCRRYLARYAEDHHRAGIGPQTPGQIHFLQADAIYAARQDTLDAAFLSTPERSTVNRRIPDRP